MVASTVIHQFADSGIRLRIDDETATLDISGDPNHPNPIKVKELAISYKTTSCGSEITNLVYVLDDADRPVAYVHPDHLNRPEEWPTWARELVDQHRPNNTSSNL
ncbi:hypothetical protein E6R18_24865 [Streptomyces sp. A1277]|uniref:hypothetical protein n=1 Tax=Streptomyces sp. A1277 TaxID=2563103 RepID=UPI0010A2282B|nr:hypothetical protein [Streptomyces sp. A1277]THA29146.1 hypothetical protein E6R18_24865 [Streptomyces sp. A1277]